jgi:hypothetical protein
VLDVQKAFPFFALNGLEAGQCYFDAAYGPCFMHAPPGVPGHDNTRYPMVNVSGIPSRSIPKTQALRDLERSYLADARWTSLLVTHSTRISPGDLDVIARSDDLYRQLLLYPFMLKALQERDAAREPSPLDLPLEAVQPTLQSPFLERPLLSFLRFFWPSASGLLVRDGWAHEATGASGPGAEIVVKTPGVRVSLLVGFFYRALEYHLHSSVFPEWEKSVVERLTRSRERFEAALQWARLTRGAVTGSLPNELWAGSRYASAFSLAWWPPHGIVVALRVKPCALTASDGAIYYYAGGRIAMPLAAGYAQPGVRMVFAIESGPHPFISKSHPFALCLAGRNPGVTECRVVSLLDHLTFAGTTLVRGMHRRTGSTLNNVECLERLGSAAEARRRGVTVQPYLR